VLWLSASRFPLTGLALVLIAFHGVVLIVGGAYTYARVPLGFAVQDWLELSRNPYDRFGHFMQGFDTGRLALSAYPGVPLRVTKRIVCTL